MSAPNHRTNSASPSSIIGAKERSTATGAIPARRHRAPYLPDRRERGGALEQDLRGEEQRAGAGLRQQSMRLAGALGDRDVPDPAPASVQDRKAGPVGFEHARPRIGDDRLDPPNEDHVRESSFQRLPGPGLHRWRRREVGDHLVHCDGAPGGRAQLRGERPNVPRSIERPAFVVFIDQFGHIDEVDPWELAEKPEDMSRGGLLLDGGGRAPRAGSPRRRAAAPRARSTTSDASDRPRPSFRRGPP